MFERSLFERLQAAGCPVHTLLVQYRMHPSIRQFPSKYFYQDQLRDGYDHAILSHKLSEFRCKWAAPASALLRAERTTWSEIGQRNMLIRIKMRLSRAGAFSALES